LTQQAREFVAGEEFQARVKRVNMRRLARDRQEAISGVKKEKEGEEGEIVMKTSTYRN
jgi:hypothetical protein